MPTWPTSPVPEMALPAHGSRATVEHPTDGGYHTARALVSRRRHLFTVRYLPLTLSQWLQFRDFVEIDLNMGVDLFTWTYPWGHTVTNVASGPPLVLTTSARHGYATGDQVFVSVGNGNADGVRTVTRIDEDQFSLNGTSGSGGGSGTVAWYSTTMKVVLPKQGHESVFPMPERLDPGSGAKPRDAEGYYSLTLQFREEF